MNIKINQAKNKITIGKQSIELTLEEMLSLRDELDKVLGRPNVIPVTYPPYEPTIIEDGPLNPEKPWREDQYPGRKKPYRTDGPVWLRDETFGPSNIKVEISEAL